MSSPWRPGPAASVDITLRPVMEAGIRGAFSCSVTRPADARIITLSLTQTGGGAAALAPCVPEEGPPGYVTETSETDGLPAGYYIFLVLLRYGDKIAGRLEVAHIYNTLTTGTGADYIFTEEDFVELTEQSAAPAADVTGAVKARADDTEARFTLTSTHTGE